MKKSIFMSAVVALTLTSCVESDSTNPTVAANSSVNTQSQVVMNSSNASGSSGGLASSTSGIGNIPDGTYRYERPEKFNVQEYVIQGSKVIWQQFYARCMVEKAIGTSYSQSNELGFKFNDVSSIEYLENYPFPTSDADSAKVCQGTKNTTLTSFQEMLLTNYSYMKRVNDTLFKIRTSHVVSGGVTWVDTTYVKFVKVK